MASAGGPERGKGGGGEGEWGERLSLKVRGESSQCLHQGDAEREEYLKVRTPIDFFSSFFSQKMKKYEESVTWRMKNTRPAPKINK